MIRLNRARTAWLVPLAYCCLTSLSSCASSGSGGGRMVRTRTPGAATSEMAVRSFLDAANSEDYSHMMNLFGTADGLAVDEFGVQDVEARMIFLSQLLEAPELHSQPGQSRDARTRQGTV